MVVDDRARSEGGYRGTLNCSTGPSTEDELHQTVPGNSPLCRVCRSHKETTDHILNGCPKLSQTEYKAMHDKVSAAVHWSLCKEYGFDHSSKWYEHRAEKVLENEDVKLHWNFHVQSNHVTEHCRPDLQLVKKKPKKPSS